MKICKNMVYKIRHMKKTQVRQNVCTELLEMIPFKLIWHYIFQKGNLISNKSKSLYS